MHNLTILKKQLVSIHQGPNLYYGHSSVSSSEMSNFFMEDKCIFEKLLLYVSKPILLDHLKVSLDFPGTADDLTMPRKQPFDVQLGQSLYTLFE